MPTSDLGHALNAVAAALVLGLGLQTGVLEGGSNILFMLIVPETKLDEVLADIERLMKCGHHLAAFITDTQVLRREKFSA